LALICEALASNCRVQLLEVRNNAIRESGATAIANMLRFNSNLESLYLNNDPWCPEQQRNALGLQGAQDLLAAVASPMHP